MDVLFLNFANSREAPLPKLQEEEDTVYKYLTPRALKQHFLLHRESYATISKIAEYLTLYRDYITIFHYSGHAEKHALLLDQEDAQAGGIAHLLGQCKALKLVVLNGCSTKAQVEELLAQGVPVVIATSAPVEDSKALRFAIRFYQALSDNATIQEAFELGVGEVKTMDASIGELVVRGIKLKETAPPEAPTWGLYHQEGKESVLEETLPRTPPKAVITDYTPNEHLIESLWDGLLDYSDAVMMLSTRRNLTLARKRMAILNSLPAPIAEHLRKLLVPVEAENRGYDKISVSRLQQCVHAYQVTMESLAYTLLAQLWERYLELRAKDEQAVLVLQHEQVKELQALLNLSPKDQEVYDYISFVRTIREIIEANQSEEEEIADSEPSQSLYVQELDDLKQLIYQGGAFQNACFFLEVLRVKLNKQSVEASEEAELCRRAEESLGAIFQELGFLAKYTLAAVQHIDVLKYRHSRQAKFDHATVYLRDLLGGLERTSLELEARYMDNRSVLLLNEESLQYLNLSPFIIDANAFEPDTDVSKVYFLSHYNADADTYTYKYINKPEDEAAAITVSKKGQFALIKEQLDEFKELLTAKTPETA
ncbi:MAG: CHAT domain-containing protein [Bacteroidota bacterium]